MAWDDLFRPGQAQASQPEPPKGPTQVQDAGLYETLAQVKTLLEARLVPTTSKQETATLGPNVQYIYESLGYQNVTIVTPDGAAGTILTLDFMGSKYTVKLASGPNSLKLMDGTVITASQAVNVVLVRDNIPGFDSVTIGGSSVALPVDLQYSEATVNVALTGSNTTGLVLASHATTTGAQTAQNVNGFSGMRIKITGDTGVTFSVNVQGTVDGTTWDTIPSTLALSPGATATTSAITAAGVYDFNVASFKQVELYINSISGQSAGVGVNAQGGFQP